MNVFHRSSPRETLPDFLLVLRAFAGIVVVLLHVYGGGPIDLSATPPLTIGSLNLSWVLCGAAHPGVYIFFVLSGYLMGKAFATGRYPSTIPGAAVFYWARFLRIYPLLFFYMVAVLTLGRISGPTPAMTYGTVVNILALHWSTAAERLTGWYSHLWTIVTECQFYLVVPVLALAVSAVRTRKAAIVAIAGITVAGLLARAIVWSTLGIGSSGWSTQNADAWQAAMQQPLVMNLDLFLAGMLLNALRIPTARLVSNRTVTLWIVGLAGFYLFAAYLTYYALFAQPAWTRTAWAVVLPTASLLFAAGAIVVAETLNGGRFSSTAAHPLAPALRVLAHLGKLTYGIYLWHLMFLGNPLPFSRTFPPLLNVIVSDVLTFVFAAAMAQVTFAGIEIPADRLKATFRRVLPEKRDLRVEVAS